MSYDTRDQSVEDGNPTLLFRFVQGTTTYNYVLGTDSVYTTADQTTWYPAVIIPSEFCHSNDVGKDTLEVALDAGNTLAATFMAGTPDAITTLTVFRVFMSPETDPIYYWKGRVASVSMSPGKVTLNCEPIFTQLKRPGLRALYTKRCRHVLYGSGCNLAAIDYRTSSTVVEVSTTAVKLKTNQDLIKTALGHWDGGYLTAPDGTSRMVVGHRDNYLILIRPIASIATYLAAHSNEAPVYLFRGCDRSYSQCVSRFNNAGNFGGFPWFAQKNPFTSQVSFM